MAFKTVFFLHIPKAAGRTLHRIIENNVPKDKIYSIDGSNRVESTRVFQSLSPLKKAALDVVKGHMYFGLHESISAASTYITLLREPVDRIVSHYYFVLNQRYHYLHDALTRCGMSLEDYATSGISEELDNGQTRLVAGEETLPIGCLTRDVLERAKQNLKDSFSVVGLTERFDETLGILKDRFGWQNLVYQRSRVNLLRPRLGEIPARTQKMIETKNSFDMELYAFAGELFEAQLERHAALS